MVKNEAGLKRATRGTRHETNCIEAFTPYKQPNYNVGELRLKGIPVFPFDHSGYLRRSELKMSRNFDVIGIFVLVV